VLAGVAWALGRPVAPAIRHGLLAVGLSSSEVASVGLVALAGADATLALGVVTGSLFAAAAGALTIAMRDFAVAAALATQAFGTAAGGVPGVPGVLMLVAGTVAAGRLRGASAGDAGDAGDASETGY
jgi:predicted Na+-dependent transporter